MNSHFPSTLQERIYFPCLIICHLASATSNSLPIHISACRLFPWARMTKKLPYGLLNDMLLGSIIRFISGESKHIHLCVKASKCAGSNETKFWSYSCIEEFYCHVTPAPQSSGLLYTDVQVVGCISVPGSQDGLWQSLLSQVTRWRIWLKSVDLTVSYI